MRRILVASGLTALLLLASCSGPSDKFVVSGKVSLDGVPLPDGDIMFIPADKQFGAEAGKIKSGVYSLSARPGKTEVQIRAMRPVPGKLGPMGEQAIEEYIPAQYNSASQLSVEVGAGKVTHDFELKSE